MTSPRPACTCPHSSPVHREGCPQMEWDIDSMAANQRAVDESLAPPTAALRERNSAERKGEPVHSGVMMYFPDALAAVSRISKAGNDKHNPGELLHWARGKSMDQLDCLARHALSPGNIDPDSGEYEMAQVAWRALAQLQLMEEQRLVAAGIMPYSGIVS